MDSVSNNQDALPLHELQIAPQWARSAAKSYENHSGEDRERKSERRGRDRDRQPRKEFPPQRAAGGPPRRDDRRGPSEMQRSQRRPQQPDRPQQPVVAAIEVSFLPEEKGLAAMIETMKQSRRAYALFDVAKLILNKPERHLVKLAREPAADGARGSLFLATSSGSPFLSQEEALRFIFRRQGDKVFKETKKPIDPPKGNFAFVNRCGITGEWLGPPNYHEYQSRLVRHHQQRLRHLPFEEFKARIQTVKDSEAVKAWIESRSFVTEYECLLDTESKVFSSRSELEKHIVENHLDQLVTSATELIISGPESRQVEHNGILEAIRLAWQAERRFPLKTANQLSERLRKEGFHFFKHNKGITCISHIKPKRFEATEGLTEHIRKLVTFLRANPDCTRKQVFEHFVPSPVTGGAPAAAQPGTASTEEERLLADLHWLIQDGYVVEFSDGRLWALDDKPAPKPPTPAPASQETTAPPVPADAGGVPDATQPQAQPASETSPVPASPSTSQETQV